MHVIVGRTPEGRIKTLTDGGLRAVNCACCSSKCWIDKFVNNGKPINVNYFGPEVIDTTCRDDFEGNYDQNIYVSSARRNYICNTYVPSIGLFNFGGYESRPLGAYYNINYWQGSDGCKGSPIAVSQYGHYATLQCFEETWRVIVNSGPIDGTPFEGFIYISPFFLSPPTNGQTLDGKFTISWNE